MFSVYVTFNRLHVVRYVFYMSIIHFMFSFTIWCAMYHTNFQLIWINVIAIWRPHGRWVVCNSFVILLNVLLSLNKDFIVITGRRVYTVPYPVEISSHWSLYPGVWSQLCGPRHLWGYVWQHVWWPWLEGISDGVYNAATRLWGG